MSKIILGRVPEEEEPDTILVGMDGVFFARVVGSPGRAVHGLAAIFADSLQVSHETGRTPRQLADERGKLLAALKVAVDRQGFTNDELIAARAFIAASEAATP